MPPSPFILGVKFCGNDDFYLLARSSIGAVQTETSRDPLRPIAEERSDVSTFVGREYFSSNHIGNSPADCP